MNRARDAGAGTKGCGWLSLFVFNDKVLSEPSMLLEFTFRQFTPITPSISLVLIYLSISAAAMVQTRAQVKAQSQAQSHPQAYLDNHDEVLSSPQLERMFCTNELLLLLLFLYLINILMI